MSITASRYADFSAACPRCQQIIQTIDITFQQGIFIYDLTFIQQELESLLVAAVQRQSQLLRSDGQTLQLPSSSLVRLPNGKKPRDFKAERERRRKALGGQVSRKRRMKKSCTKLLLSKSLSERKVNGSVSWKKHSSTPTIRSESNGHSTRPARSYRPINFTSPFLYETNHRNGHQHSPGTKALSNSLSIPDQLWTQVLALQQPTAVPTRDSCQAIEKLLDIDQSLLNDCNEETDFHQLRQLINIKDYCLSAETYVHPQLKYSLAIKHNAHFARQVETISSHTGHKNGSSPSKQHRSKRKDSTVMSNGNQDSSIHVDDSILSMLRRDDHTFTSKYAELQHLIAESISLERLALERAERSFREETIRIELMEMDDKILEITNSIRQRKRPSENAVSLSKLTSPMKNSNHSHPYQNGTNGSNAWRKGRRQSTLRVYDELARLVDERMEMEKQLEDV